MMPGTYTLTITPGDPYLVKIITDVKVTTGSTTDLGQIQMNRLPIGQVDPMGTDDIKLGH